MLLTIIALKKAKNSEIQETDIWIQNKIPYHYSLPCIIRHGFFWWKWNASII
jgi:hypothetical protein